MIRKFKHITQFRHEQTPKETYLEVIEGTTIKGFNFWILGFSMILACIGLNTDNLSAIIGAMLISPLMGPIQGFSFGLAIGDMTLKKISILNWLLMSLIALTASILYFLITPFYFDTSALTSFKNATVFDILIAFFGGMAGFFGLLKREGTKVIAGVAVATACMPPLCTAGYGIAHLDMEFVFGGIYFYFVNCLFIGIATFFITKITGFTYKGENTMTTSLLEVWFWRVFTVAMIIPSIYLAINKWNEMKTDSIKMSVEKRMDILEEKLKKIENNH